jgi:NADH-quinone oxidoreductase subunit N
MIQHNETGAKARKCAARFLLTSYAMSAILLYGMSIFYFGSGSLSFPKINFDKSFATTVGTTLVTSALLFKLGLAPFHAWMVDVYEKASTGLVMFFDAIWKFFMVFIFIRFFKFVLQGGCQLHQFLMPLSILSMLIGTVMPIFQKNIKKFVAYASVGHMGFVTTVFAIADDITATSDALLYIISYSLASICFFITVLYIKKRRILTTFEDLAGLINDAPMLGGSIIVSMFAMIGLPPFISFIAKFKILKLQLLSRNYVLLAVSIIYSILSILYASKCIMNVFSASKNTDQIKSTRSSPLLTLSLCILLISPIFYMALNDWFINILKNI